MIFHHMPLSTIVLCGTVRYVDNLLLCTNGHSVKCQMHHISFYFDPIDAPVDIVNMQF